jgi:NADP-dependent 3-hydroxy acid dehydrogenase YdfG
LITGATGGIGGAVAELLRDAGHDLILAGRSAERLDETARILAGSSPRTRTPRTRGDPPPYVRTVVVDLAEPRGIEAALSDVELPSLDGLVHSAGVIKLGTVAEARVDGWVEQLMVNVAGPAELTRLLLPALRAARGHIVFVNSGSGLHARPGWGGYAASKHALRALADSLRAEEPGIRVTSVFPGRTAGDMQRRVRAQEDGEYDPDAYMSARTVATVISHTLDTPEDATVTEVSVRR